MMPYEFGRVCVLAGGISSEREISLRSGMFVYNALKQSGCDVHIFDVSGNVELSLRDIDADVVFLTLHGGAGEDGTVQRMLEKRHIPYTGSDAGSSYLAMNKVASKKIFRDSGIPVPDYMLVEKGNLDVLRRRFSVPLVVKPRGGGSSIGLTVVRKESELQEAVRMALRFDAYALIERFIEGRELTVGIFDTRPLPVVEIVAKENIYDFEAKYIDSETSYIVPARITKEIETRAKQLAVGAHTALGCRDLSRVDMRMDTAGDLFILEVNTIPGLTARSLLPKAAAAAGIEFGELCIKLLEFALERAHVKK